MIFVDTSFWVALTNRRDDRHDEAALLLGVSESFFAVYVSYDYRDAFGLLILMLVLIFRPQGLIGEKGRDI